MLALIRGRNGLLPFLLHAFLLSLVVTALPPGQGDFNGFPYKNLDNPHAIEPVSVSRTQRGQPNSFHPGHFGGQEPFNPLGNHAVAPPNAPLVPNPYGSNPPLPTAGSGFSATTSYNPGLPHEIAAHTADSENDKNLFWTYPSELSDDPSGYVVGSHGQGATEEPYGDLSYGHPDGNLFDLVGNPYVGGSLSGTSGDYTEGVYNQAQPNPLGWSHPNNLQWTNGAKEHFVATPGHQEATEAEYIFEQEFQNVRPANVQNPWTLGSPNDQSNGLPSTAGGDFAAMVSSNSQIDQAGFSAILSEYDGQPNDSQESPSVLPVSTSHNGPVSTDPALNPNHSPQSSFHDHTANPLQSTGWPNTLRRRRMPKNPSELQSAKVEDFDTRPVRDLDRQSSGLDELEHSFDRYLTKMANKLAKDPSDANFVGSLYRSMPKRHKKVKHPPIYVFSAAFVHFYDSLLSKSVQPAVSGSVENDNIDVLSRNLYFLQARKYAELITEAYIRGWFVKQWKSKIQHAKVDAIVLWCYLKHFTSKDEIELEARTETSQKPKDTSTNLKNLQIRLDFLESEEKSYRTYLENDLFEVSASGDPLANSFENKIRHYAESLQEVDDQATKILELLKPDSSEENIVETALISMKRRFRDMGIEHPSNLGTRLRRNHNNPHEVFAALPPPEKLSSAYEKAVDDDLAALKVASVKFKTLVSEPPFLGQSSDSNHPVIEIDPDSATDLFKLNSAFEPFMAFVNPLSPAKERGPPKRAGAPKAQRTGATSSRVRLGYP
ncbi:hypothetical protein CXG81DRAFT_20245 [Caulochytrium protostelioides]|uniref:Uncharacterized protein n=1 Tax=Caulochytrium protostelioides TaxID=1555241 RepID=A0A4P9X3U4_9FUNG|nr:hypothetical protein CAUPRSCDRAFT_10989 [Caulochytrium protostelioides]RKO99691.1 hypothetical protein CXG81DRAFT_20245 [Caulochytrium protostelioides]|eukprot:RKO99691.1 hypothetical protein CXG81DRAFT_20245 [Caulochytrium protostelioides]